MERYQRAMVNIMTQRGSPQLVRVNIDASSHMSKSGSTQINIKTLNCPSGTLQKPNYLTVPFTTLSDPMNAKDPKRPKDQEASKFIAGDDTQLLIGKALKHDIKKKKKQPLKGTFGHFLK